MKVIKRNGTIVDFDKKRIINAVVGVIVMLALIVILKVFVSEIAGVRKWAESLTKTK